MRVDPQIKIKQKEGSGTRMEKLSRNIAVFLCFAVIYYFFIKLLFL